MLNWKRLIGFAAMLMLAFVTTTSNAKAQYPLGEAGESELPLEDMCEMLDAMHGQFQGIHTEWIQRANSIIAGLDYWIGISPSGGDFSVACMNLRYWTIDMRTYLESAPYYHRTEYQPWIDAVAGYEAACASLADAIANNDSYGIAYWTSERDIYFVLFNQVGMSLTRYYISHQNYNQPGNYWAPWLHFLWNDVADFNAQWSLNL